MSMNPLGLGLRRPRRAVLSAVTACVLSTGGQVLGGPANGSGGGNASPR